LVALHQFGILPNPSSIQSCLPNYRLPQRARPSGMTRANHLLESKVAHPWATADQLTDHQVHIPFIGPYLLPFRSAEIADITNPKAALGRSTS